MNRWMRVLFLRLLVLPTICALVVGVGLRYWFGIQDPQVTIPSPTMPSPNGFDLLKIAGEKVRADTTALQGFTGDNLPPLGSELSKEQAEKRWNVEQRTMIANLLRRHADTLALTRKALDMECRMPSMRSWTDLCPYYSDFRDLARLMVLEGKYARANGATPDDVARKYLDIIRLGGKVSQGGPLIGRLVSIAITTIGQQALEPLAGEVSPVMARKVIQTIKQCQRNRPSFAETLTEEKYGMQSGVLEIFQHPERFTADLGADEGMAQSIRMLPLAYLIWGKRTMFDNVTRQMDQVIAQAKQPYSADTPEIIVADDPISQIVFPLFSQARFKDVLIQTQDELLIAQFAVDAYFKEYQRDPLPLEKLTKAGYPIPVDPFANGKPLHYNLRGAVFFWYSVGPDRKDDGGKPCENTLTQGKQKFQVNPSSMGDIVPGENVFK